MALPAGTVTFVFTDLEGSTALLKQLGERYGEVLSEHRRIVRETFSAAGGSEIDTQGDAFFYAFPRAREAVTSSVEVQRQHAAADWPDGATVRVRIGLHTGEPSVAEEGYLGLDVVRAARICTVARGGNVLLSETTRALIGSSLPDGVSVFPIGERHLKGIDEPERVFELEIEGVETTPEPKPPPAAAPENLPKPPKRKPKQPKPGREKELERRFESFGERLADGIQERVLRSLDRRLAKLGPPPDAPGDDTAVDEIAERASFDDKIQARVEELLRRHGVEP
ncbi:MAG TPA: adenylate/guanylate cyclase domain-containing protein [Gaiellaceae bacterium]|nr:adenylate/guanylate cyclase domain-containing protein [Gaiellaceae bacterium]